MLEIKQDHNFGLMNTVSLDSKKLSEWAIYTQKDKQMILDNDFSSMIWNGISKSTKANIEKIIFQNNHFYVI